MSALLRANGHETSAVNLDWFPGNEELIELVREKIKNVDIIGMGFTFHQQDFVKKWTALLKNDFNVPVIVGGLYPSMRPEEVIQWDGVDYLCRGEGELPLLMLMNSLEKTDGRTDTPGIWYKNGGTPVKNSIPPIKGSLDDYPNYDYSLFSLGETNAARKRLKPVMYLASRGCPFSCTYCASPAIRDLYPNRGKWVRFQSVDRVMEELKVLLGKAPYARTITFADITFNFKKKWILEFCEKYKKEIGLPYRCTIRLDLMTREIAESMADSGCYRVSYGIETGNEWLRENILKRPWPNEKMIEQALNIHNSGMQATSSNMVGLPHETLAMSLETMKFNARCKADTAIVSIFCPHPNTWLKTYCEERKLIGEAHVEDEMSDTMLKQDCITPAEVRYAHRTFRTMVAIYRWLYDQPQFLQKPLKRIVGRLYLSKTIPHDFVVKVHEKYFHEWLLSRQYKRLEGPLLEKFVIESK